MSQRAIDLSKRIEIFRDDVLAFVKTLSGDEQHAMCDWEHWPAVVTARHLGSQHLGAFINILRMVVQGKDLPPLTMDQINEMSKQDSRAHLDCTKSDALEQLQKNGAEFAAFVAGLNDEDLDRKGSMPAFGGEVTVEQLIEFVVFKSAQQHLDSMKTAVGR